MTVLRLQARDVFTAVAGGEAREGVLGGDAFCVCLAPSQDKG